MSTIDPAAHPAGSCREPLPAGLAPGRSPAGPVPPPPRPATAPGRAARLREERTRRGWSRQEMARRLREAALPDQLPGLESLLHNLYRWERGQDGPSERYRLLYCQVLGLSEQELFGTGGAAPPPSLQVEQPVTAESVPSGKVVIAVPPDFGRLTIEITTSPVGPADPAGPAAANGTQLTLVKTPPPEPPPVIQQRHFRA